MGLPVVESKNIKNHNKKCFCSAIVKCCFADFEQCQTDCVCALASKVVDLTHLVSIIFVQPHYMWQLFKSMSQDFATINKVFFSLSSFVIIPLLSPLLSCVSVLPPRGAAPEGSGPPQLSVSSFR